MEKPSEGKGFTPEKYGMFFCPDCSGSGRSFANAKEMNVCKVCGGFGLIKKNKNSFSNRAYSPLVLVNL